MTNVLASAPPTSPRDPARDEAQRGELDDAVVADEVFGMLMGEMVAPRKTFILTTPGTSETSTSAVSLASELRCLHRPRRKNH